MTKDGFPQKLVDWELFALWRAKFAAMRKVRFPGVVSAARNAPFRIVAGQVCPRDESEKFGFRGLWVSRPNSRRSTFKVDRRETGSRNATRAAAGMRAHLLLARLCLSLLVGPLHAINARYKMCELVCAETPGMRWVLPCFIASSNVRVRTGNCEVNLLTE